MEASVARARFGGSAATGGVAGSAEYAAGEIALFPGPPGGLFRVRSGLMRLHAVGAGGVGLTLRYVKPGGYYGEESLTGRERPYFAEAVTHSTVETILLSALRGDELVELAASLASFLEHMNGALLRVAASPLRARVAAELLELADSALAGRTDAGHSVVYLTHDDLAAAVGSVRETVTKVIGELARSGALKAGYGKIVVLNPALLADLAHA